MKAAFALLALCLVSASAKNIAPEESPESFVGTFVDEATDIAIAAAKELKKQLAALVEEKVQEVNDLLEKIDEFRNESVACVDAELPLIESIVENLDANINICQTEAAKAAAQIESDMEKAVQQLAFGGVDVIQAYRRCAKMDDGLRKRICQAYADIKRTTYTWRARRSIRKVKALRQNVPAVAINANTCIKVAGSEAAGELRVPVSDIEACIENAKP